MTAKPVNCRKWKLFVQAYVELRWTDPGRRALGAVRHVAGTGLAGGRGGRQPDSRQRGARRGQLF